MHMHTWWYLQIKNLIEERTKQLDAQFLQLNSTDESTSKLLPQLATQIQVCSKIVDPYVLHIAVTLSSSSVGLL